MRVGRFLGMLVAIGLAAGPARAAVTDLGLLANGQNFTLNILPEGAPPSALDEFRFELASELELGVELLPFFKTSASLIAPGGDASAFVSFPEGTSFAAFLAAGTYSFGVDRVFGDAVAAGYSLDVAVTPLPAGALLLAPALLGLVALTRRRARAG